MSSTPNAPNTFMGLDLAGNPERPTGWAVVDEYCRLCMEPGELLSDEDILNKVEKIRPEWIGIDAPLSFPRDKVRCCDRQLRIFGSPALPPFFMVSLLRRGIRLCDVFTQRGYSCIEVYPRATQHIIGIKTQGKKPQRNWRISCQEGLFKWVRALPSPNEKVFSSHILDAILCAYTAYCRGRGSYQEIGDEEGWVVVPG